MRATPANFEHVVVLMREAESTLRPGIEKLPGLIHYYVGSDAKTLTLHNTSTWETVEAAEQMASYQPMLDLAERFAQEGIEFIRPVMNFTELWSIAARQ